jgi:hypothetical protein
MLKKHYVQMDWIQVEPKRFQGQSLVHMNVGEFLVHLKNDYLFKMAPVHFVRTRP